MKKAFLFLCLLPLCGNGQPKITVTKLPAPGKWVILNDLPTGAVFRHYTGGDLWMKCELRSSLVPPYDIHGVTQPSHPSWYSEQLRMAELNMHRWHLATVTGTISVASLDLPQDVWVVSLSKPGILAKMRATEEVLTVAKVTVGVQEYIP